MTKITKIDDKGFSVDINGKISTMPASYEASGEGDTITIRHICTGNTYIRKQFSEFEVDGETFPSVEETTIALNAIIRNFDFGGSSPSPTPSAKTYAEIIAMLSFEELTPGQQYEISDYQTIYSQTYYDSDSGEEIPHINSGPVEPIVVTALTANSLLPEAYSAVNGDKLLYDVAPTTAKYDWCADGNKGLIYRRVDSNNNDCPYDHKAVRFPRWAVDYNAISVFSTGANYSVGAICRNAGSADGKVYMCINSFTAGTSGCNPTTSNSRYWHPLLTNVSGSSRSYFYGKFGESEQWGLNLFIEGLLSDYIFIPLDPASLKMFYTFQQEEIDASSINANNNTIRAYRAIPSKPYPISLPNTNYWGRTLSCHDNDINMKDSVFSSLFPSINNNIIKRGESCIVGTAGGNTLRYFNFSVIEALSGNKIEQMDYCFMTTASNNIGKVLSALILKSAQNNAVRQFLSNLFGGGFYSNFVNYLGGSNMGMRDFSGCSFDIELSVNLDELPSASGVRCIMTPGYRCKATVTDDNGTETFVMLDEY